MKNKMTHQPGRGRGLPSRGQPGEPLAGGGAKQGRATMIQRLRRFLLDHEGNLQMQKVNKLPAILQAMSQQGNSPKGKLARKLFITLRREDGSVDIEKLQHLLQSGKINNKVVLSQEISPSDDLHQKVAQLENHIHKIEGVLQAVVNILDKQHGKEIPKEQAVPQGGGGAWFDHFLEPNV